MGHDEECREKTYDVQAGDRQFSLRAIHRRDPSPVKWGLGGHFDVNVTPGLSPLFWMSRSVRFTDVSVLDENRIAPRYAPNYSIAVTEVSAGIAGSKENFFDPPRCDCTPSLSFLSIFGGAGRERRRLESQQQIVADTRLERVM